MREENERRSVTVLKHDRGPRFVHLGRGDVSVGVSSAGGPLVFAQLY